MLALCSDSAKKSGEDILLEFVYLFVQDNGNKLPMKCKHLALLAFLTAMIADLLSLKLILEMTWLCRVD